MPMIRLSSRLVPRTALAALIALAGVLVLPGVQAQDTRSAAALHVSRAAWADVPTAAAATTSARGAQRAVAPLRFRASTLDRSTLGSLMLAAPMENTAAARQNPLVLSLPHPDGSFQRFALAESPIMEPGLAARHPGIKTYAGRGIDDPLASIRMDMGPLGLHASVRSPKGAWYVEPYYHLDQSLYASYFRRDLPNPRAALVEGLLGEAQMSIERGAYRASDTVRVQGLGFVPGALVAVTVKAAGDFAPRQVLHSTANEDGTLAIQLQADPYKNAGSYTVTASDGRSTASVNYRVVAEGQNIAASVGNVLRTYRLALLTDPAYATYFGGSANVTAAKVTLVNRVTQIYEDETSIRLVLIANNDLLNLDTAAQFSQPNGPCGGSACYPSASVSCTGTTLTRTRQVIGLLVGASAFDVGHIAVGAGGGGVASLGVVGGSNKAQGCTGLPQPTGDSFAVDYVAHEIGHQFAGNHTFNGVVGNCSGGNRSSANSVEPGSGSSVMAYAGICGTDNLQPHSDPYWSQRSFDEITTYVSAAETNLSEVQQAALANFNTDGQRFVLRYNGADSVPIVRGAAGNFNTAGVKAAIEGIAGWPAGGTVTVSTLGDTGFTISFGGTLAGTNAAPLQLLGCTAPCTGYVGEIVAGGLTARGGTATATNNSAPAVTVPASFTIPVRTPFALSGSATDVEGDPITYMWEQTDRGAATGTSLTTNTKTNGPLFRQFGTYANVTAAGSLLYNSPGQNMVDTNPTRVFPDLPQLLGNNTNAETGTCPAASPTPTVPQLDCFSEFLPTADYVGFAGVNASPARLNFRLTVRDGRGGVNSANTSLVLAPTAGPFLVTYPNTAVSLASNSRQTITWAVANTNLAPVNTTDVRITLSVDGGLSYPFTLAASTPNTGAAPVLLPAGQRTSQARVKVEALNNVFFDVSNANFTIRLEGDLNDDGVVTCADAAIIIPLIDIAVGQPGFDPRADINGNGIIDRRDLRFVTQRLPPGTVCPP
jgi:trimeric autotransporter adhesin